MNSIKELNQILYNYLKNSNAEEFIFIQRIIDIILNNKHHFEYKGFNKQIELYRSLTLVYKFLKQLNPNYEKYFERKLDDGTISFNYDYEIGCSYFDESYNKRILIPVTHSIHDSFVIIHELMHNKNLKIDSDSITRHLFTESMSILGEMLFHDYLVEKHLYVHDANKHMEDVFWAAYRITMKNDFEVKLSLSYLDDNYLSDNTITSLYKKDDEYNWQIYYSIIDALNYKTLSIDTEQRYSIGIVFASYLHQRIKKNPNKKYELFELNEIINEISIEELMYYLDLDVEDFDNSILTYDSVKKLEKAYKKELKSLR